MKCQNSERFAKTRTDQRKALGSAILRARIGSALHEEFIRACRPEDMLLVARLLDLVKYRRGCRTYLRTAEELIANGVQLDGFTASLRARVGKTLHEEFIQSSNSKDMLLVARLLSVVRYRRGCRTYLRTAEELIANGVRPDGFEASSILLNELFLLAGELDTRATHAFLARQAYESDEGIRFWALTAMGYERKSFDKRIPLDIIRVCESDRVIMSALYSLLCNSSQLDRDDIQQVARFLNTNDPHARTYASEILAQHSNE